MKLSSVIGSALIGLLVCGCSDSAGPSSEPAREIGIRVTGDLEYSASADDILGQHFTSGSLAAGSYTAFANGQGAAEMIVMSYDVMGRIAVGAYPAAYAEPGTSVPPGAVQVQLALRPLNQLTNYFHATSGSLRVLTLRIPVIPSTRSGGSRPAVPAQAVHAFR